jgi:hypothetical protein
VGSGQDPADIVGVGHPAMYEAYLEKYSEGAFAALAKARLDELRP